MKQKRIVETISAKVLTELKSPAGTWSYATLQEMQLNSEYFNLASTTQLFQILLKEIESDAKPLTIYKAAQLISYLYHLNFPNVKIVLQAKLHKMMHFLDFESQDPFMVAAIGLMDSVLIPIKSSNQISPLPKSTSYASNHKCVQKKRTKSVETKEKKHHNIMFFLPSTYLSSSQSNSSSKKKTRIICCSPPPLRAL